MPELSERHGLFYRPDTADEAVLVDVFKRRQYDLSEVPLRPAPDRPMIIDAGAHIGAASAWFADLHPNGWIIAVEPERQNHTLLMQNARGRPVMPMLGALTARRRSYAVIDTGGGTWGYRVHQGVGTAVSATMRDLLAMRGDYAPWIVKIDIEGGEADLFASDTAWIDQFPVVMVELHDWMIKDCGDTYRAAMADRNRHEFTCGEAAVSVREDWLL